MERPADSPVTDGRLSHEMGKLIAITGAWTLRLKAGLPAAKAPGSAAIPAAR